MNSFTRRSCLKSVTFGAGAALLNPICMQLSAHAAGAPQAVRQRFIFIVQSNGFDPNHIIPSGVTRRKDKELPGNEATEIVALAGRELPDAIKPLTPYLDRLTLIRGLSGCTAEGGTGGHSTNHGALGCYPGNIGAFAQTIDCALGEATPAIIPNIGLGILEKPEQMLNYQISARAPGKIFPIQCSPEQAFRGLFGSVIGGDKRATFDQRTNLLDFMKDDIRRAKQQLVGEEREKLDEYLTAFESLHVRQGKIEAIKPALAAALPTLDEHFAKPTNANKLRAQFEIGVAALIAGLTNVVTLTSGGGGQNYLSFPDIGVPIGGHQYGHGKGVNDLSAEDCFVTVRQFHCSLIAKLAARLDSIREGDGTMLDNTLIVYLSDAGEAHHPKLKEWPVVLLGGINGKLQPGGRYLQIPAYGQAKHRRMANLYLTLLQAAGTPRDQFGMLDNGLRDIDQHGIISELFV